MNINVDSLRACYQAVINSHLMRPLYGTYCFTGIPGTVEKLLRGFTPLPVLPDNVVGDFGKRYSTVVLLLVDGMGWRIFHQFLDRVAPLSRLGNEGRLSCLTSQFPSTTASHLVTIHTGLPVHEHGVFEWYYYERLIGRVIAPVLLSGAYDNEKDSLLRDGFKAREILPRGQLYERFLSDGISSFIFQSKLFTPSTFLSTVAPSAQVIPFENLGSGTKLLAEHIRTLSGSNYYFMYIHTLDSLCHAIGPYDDKVCSHLSDVFSILEENLFRTIRAQSDDALLIICADHGQIPVSPMRTVFLDTSVKSLESFFSKRSPLPFGGSSRDLFLYPTSTGAEMLDTISQAVTDNIAVHTVQSLMDVGVLVSVSDSLLKDRLGNLVLLPHPGYQVSLSAIGKPEWDFNGHHGGMSFEEMTVPFFCIPGSQL